MHIVVAKGKLVVYNMRTEDTAMNNLTRKTAVKLGLIALAVMVTTAIIIKLTTTPPSDMTDEIMTIVSNPNTAYDDSILETTDDEHDLEVQTDVETEKSTISDDEQDNEHMADEDSRSISTNNISSNNHSTASNDIERDLTARAASHDSQNALAQTSTPSAIVQSEANNTSSCPVAIINEVRSEYGLSTLPTNSILNEAAQIRANEVTGGTWGHTRPCGRTWQTAVHDMGYTTGRSSAENISGNAFDGWRRSPGHLEWVLRTDWTHMGVAQSGNVTVAIFMNGGATLIETPNTEPPPPPQTTTPQPIETAPPTQEAAPQPAPPPPTEQPTAPVTGFDCPQPYYLCFCLPGNPCSP